MTEVWRLVDDLDAGLSGAGQMGADRGMLQAVAAGGTPVLRVYRWAPAVSLGRFQAESDVDHDACARLGVEVVRRPTGGKGLLHGGDLTYAVAMPRPEGEGGSIDAVYEVLAGALIAGLARLGVTAAIAHHHGPAGPVCFATQHGADLRVGERKLCGSAQVRHGGAVLQHGSILLRRLAYDEIDVFRAAPGTNARQVRRAARARLRAATVTLEELGASTDARAVADAVVEGFTSTLDLEFTSGVASRPRAVGVHLPST